MQLLSKQTKNWNTVKLGDIAIEGPNNGIFKQRHEFGNGVPIVNVADLYSYPRVDFRSLERVSVSEKELSKFSIKAGDLFFCRSSLKREGIGWCCYAHKLPEPAVYDCHVMRVRLDPDKADPEFITYYWSHPDMRSEVIRNSHTATMTTMSQKDLSNVSILLPPLEEQKRIAEIVRKCDRIRRIRRFSQQNSDTYLQSAFVEIFGDPLYNSGGWKMKMMEEIANIQGGLQLSQKRERLKLKRPYLRVANVYRNNLDLSEIKDIGLTESEFERVKLINQDILIVEGHGNANEIGRCSVWNGSIENCVHQNHLIRARPNPSIVNSYYLSYFINSSGGKKHFQDASNTTSGLNTISTGIVKKCHVPCPPLPLQEKFAQVVRRFERIRTQQREAERQAEHLFQTVLHRAFQGEL